MGVNVNVDTCDGCGDCVDTCPTEAIVIENEKAVVDNDICIDCAACIDACPTDSLTME
ncbi:MAG: 4Fe-4S binding protein [Candidatus Hydrogenedens sp.]|jgi:ferredoxin|nr:4Fe-4S binding protein [Candidatus Hydrogenedens sp.]